jgi:hypothetical protein
MQAKIVVFANLRCSAGIEGLYSTYSEGSVWGKNRLRYIHGINGDLFKDPSMCVVETSVERLWAIWESCRQCFETVTIFDGAGYGSGSDFC